MQKEFTSQKYSTFFDGRVLQICFFSQGCRYHKNGNCIMCNYGKGIEHDLKVEDIKKIISEVFSNLEILPNVLLLNSLGSVLDTDEMPIENIVTLLDLLADIEIKTIIFETHYLTINVSILKLIQQKLPNKSIAIELGLESSNKQIREKKTILPICKLEEYPKLMEIYQMFNSNKNSDNRIRLLSGMIDRGDER